MECSIQSFVSRQTVKTKIHALDFDRMPKSCVPKKRKVKYLYIDADEDHVALQFQNTKGDLQANEWGHRSNCAIAKLVYVYEGVEKEHPKSKRHRLVNVYYFSGTYPGETGNAALWDEVCQYLDNTYELESVEKIFLNGDGGAWIKAGKKRISGITYVLDEFHIQEYLLRATSHLPGSAEGHVSHVLSDRMSSRPMGWSMTGVDKMAHLRAYKRNGGDMLELVRAQRAEMPKAAGAENEVISATEMLSYERKSYSELGQYMESISHPLSLDSKKKLWFQSQIWGL